MYNNSRFDPQDGDNMRSRGGSSAYEVPQCYLAGRPAPNPANVTHAMLKFVIDSYMVAKIMSFKIADISDEVG